MPISIRGVTYPSQIEAAKALGVKQPTIHKALEKGTLDKVGLGRQRQKELTND